jgi:hypothetical protein
LTDHVEGYLEVGCDEKGDIVVNMPHPAGHVVFSQNQAKEFCKVLMHHAMRRCDCRDFKTLGPCQNPGCTNMVPAPGANREKYPNSVGHYNMKPDSHERWVGRKLYCSYECRQSAGAKRHRARKKLARQK